MSVLSLYESSFNVSSSAIASSNACNQPTQYTCTQLSQLHKKLKLAHTQLPSIGFRSWSRFLAVSLQLMWVINSVVGCHYFSPGLQLPAQPLRGLLQILVLGKDTGTVGVNSLHLDCYSTTSWLRFEHRSFCTWVQRANHSATEPPLSSTALDYRARYQLFVCMSICMQLQCCATLFVSH